MLEQAMPARAERPAVGQAQQMPAVRRCTVGCRFTHVAFG
jgi:hypothetical protein